MGKKSKDDTDRRCGDCRNLKKGRCQRKDKARKPSSKACGSFDPR